MFDNTETLEERVTVVFNTLHTLQEEHFNSVLDWEDDQGDPDAPMQKRGHETAADALTTALHFIRAALNYGD